MKRDLVSLSDWSREEIWEVLELAAHLKREQRAGVRHDHILRGKTLALIFQKPSLRTRVSFEVGDVAVRRLRPCILARRT
jgi:ornithine carbamoyltransferase